MRYCFLILIIISFSISSCHDENPNSNAISDFRFPIQEGLHKIVSIGVVGSDDGTLEKIFTNDELIKLTHSENPILRAYAFRCIWQRPSLDHFDLAVNHLDDTAMVSTIEGTWWGTVSDDILMGMNWKTEAAKEKAIDIVLKKHNYLRGAYTILEHIKPDSNYYSIIKKMAITPRKLNSEGYEMGFHNREYALLGLAKFRKQEDIPLIKNILEEKFQVLNPASFKLMQDYPDTSLMDIFDKFYSKVFYRGWCTGGWSEYFGEFNVQVGPGQFIDALLEQKNDRAATLLEKMIVDLPIKMCNVDWGMYVHQIEVGVWKRDCPAYWKLREKVGAKAKEYLNSLISGPKIEQHTPTENNERIVRWLDYELPL